MGNFVIIIVSANGLALLGARPYARTAMTNSAGGSSALREYYKCAILHRRNELIISFCGKHIAGNMEGVNMQFREHEGIGDDDCKEVYMSETIKLSC